MVPPEIAASHYVPLTRGKLTSLRPQRPAALFRAAVYLDQWLSLLAVLAAFTADIPLTALISSGAHHAADLPTLLLRWQSAAR